MTGSPISCDLLHPPAEPFALFRLWYGEAERCQDIRYAHAMCLSTIGLDGLPDARTVLLKLFDDDGFTFFTDAESPKGQQLAVAPGAALTFHWEPLEKQVRIRGNVDPASEEVSDACFKRRPRGSQLTAWACRQSSPLTSQAEFDERIDFFQRKFDGVEAVPRPPRWQAYRLAPLTVEFWQARANRRHDRLLFSLQQDGSWSRNVLYP